MTVVRGKILFVQDLSIHTRRPHEVPGIEAAFTGNTTHYLAIPSGIGD
jgi:hypothetical protein